MLNLMEKLIRGSTFQNEELEVQKNYYLVVFRTGL